MMTPQDYSSNYRKYQSAHSVAVRTISRFLRTVAALICESQHNSILNIGCGESFDFYHLMRIKEFKFDLCLGVERLS